MSMSGRRGWAPIASAVIGLGLLVVALQTASSPPRTIKVDAVIPAYALGDLILSADAIAVVTPSGSPRVHWNSADNRPWALDELGRRSHIFRDQDVTVIRSVAGKVPASFVLRGAGGTLDGITIEYETGSDLQEDREYLVFLDFADTMTREGIDPQWTVRWQAHGLFAKAADGKWTNGFGVSFTDEELSHAIK